MSDIGPSTGRTVNFHEPVIDYAGISPVIALTVGLCVVLLSGRLQAAEARRRRR